MPFPRSSERMYNHICLYDPTVQADVLMQARQRDSNVVIDFSDEQVVQEIK